MLSGVVVLLFLVVGPVPFALAAQEAAGNALAGNSETVTLAVAIAKVIGSLAVVVGLMLLTVYLIRKMGVGRSALRSNNMIKVLDTRMIAPKKYVAVVDIAGECVALGVTEQQINLLTKVDAADYAAREVDDDGRPMRFQNFLQRAAGTLQKNTQEG